MRRQSLALLSAAVLSISAVTAQAALQINEVFTNPPGADDAQEFFELKSTTNGVEAMTGLHLVILEGEGAAAGTIDQAFDLNAFSTGTNGLFYWRADNAVGSFNPAPAAASTVNTSNFNPDLENGTQTYLLVSGYTGTLATDLDANDDGTFDSTPWTSVIDAIGVRDNSLTGDFTYGAATGFADFPIAPAGFEAETILRLSTGEWVESDIAGTNPGGPYTFGALETFYINGSIVPVALLDFDDVSPGSINPTLVPEPASVALLAIGASFLMRRRRSI